MEFMGVILRRYIDFLILLIPSPLVSTLFCRIPTFCSFFKMFFVLVTVLFVIYVTIFSLSINTHSGDYWRPPEAI